MKTENIKNFMQAALRVAGYSQKGLASAIANAYPESDYVEFVKDHIIAKLTATLGAAGLTDENLPAILAGALLVSREVEDIIANNPQVPPALREKCADDVEDIFRESAEDASLAAVKAGTVAGGALALAYEQAGELARQEWAREAQVTKENLRIFTLHPNVGKCALWEREKSSEFVRQWGGSEAGLAQLLTSFSAEFADLEKLAGGRAKEAYAIFFNGEHPQWREKLLAVAEQQFGAGALEYQTLAFHFAAEKRADFIHTTQQ